jgi:hypothetical protein
MTNNISKILLQYEKLLQPLENTLCTITLLVNYCESYTYYPT